MLCRILDDQSAQILLTGARLTMNVLDVSNARGLKGKASPANAAGVILSASVRHEVPF